MEKILLLSIGASESKDKNLEVTIITDYLDQQDMIREVIRNNDDINKSNTVIHTNRPSNYKDLVDLGYHILSTKDYQGLEEIKGYALSLVKSNNSELPKFHKDCSCS